MHVRGLIRRLLAVLVTVGLVAAPMVTPAAAKRLPVAAMDMPAMDMPAMSNDMTCCEAVMKDGMNCCPDKQSNDCRDCPLVAICTLTFAQAEPTSANAIPAPALPNRRLFFAIDDLIADGLIGPPPDHPPRILV
jgi:hypothetical protein